ncbi:BPTD_3080 family restriction endonuclease [Faunimonas sp. B44]|uniref:BPTD_3080 family restriction endonuclease n=1 Tax=Faunimonas sp. B44 TaxID=3461493 RepID=UPI00404518E1
MTPATQKFFEQPILNSPYAEPSRHWELDLQGRPTDRILPSRRKAELVSAIPAPRRRTRFEQREMVYDTGHGLSTDAQEYNPTPIINELRQEIETWRNLPNPEQWQVTPVTATLLRHWRALQNDPTRPIRPFFCQIEAVETAIWLAEVAPKAGRRGRRFLDWLKDANASATAPGAPELFRIALKLATGAGKTTVMAMLIAWQALNAARMRNSKLFSRGFLLIAPGITIRDRLRVLLPSDPDNYYRRLDLVPTELMPELGAAKVVITNYHAFQLRERMPLARGTREALKGHGADIATLETEGQMLQRVMADLMGLGPIMVINDEAHHCYRERPQEEAVALSREEKAEAKENEEAARLWISGIEAVKRSLGVAAVYDLSATPFFLAGSGWPEGTLFPWVVSDFSLMDAIECGIVKLPRVPVADNLASGRTPLYRNLWPTIRDKMPKKGRGSGKPDPLSLPIELQTALEALYGHYEKTYNAWRAKGIGVPPVFIVVCNDTVNSALVADYIAGFERETKDGEIHFHQGRLELFRNYTDGGERLSRPRTLLIDSQRIDSGEAIDAKFRDAYEAEIEAFRKEKAQRDGAGEAQKLSDEEILREVLNTVGKAGRLGAEVRCVVSVSMLTEGWDANTVTHILGLRAFSTKLICEQVIGRALRRLSYETDPATGLFGVEYADIMGIDDLNFSAQAIAAPVKPPREIVTIRAVSPERDHLEIEFPRVAGFRLELPGERLTADFSRLEPYVLDPDKVGSTEVTMQGIVGMPEKLTLEHLKAMRPSEIVFRLATHLLTEKLRDADEAPKLHLFPQCQRLVKQWLDAGLLVCKGGTVPAQITYKQFADEVTEQIAASINVGAGGAGAIRAILDPYAPTGSTMDVAFNVTSADLYSPDPDKSHVNWIVLDSGWEAQCAQAIEDHPRVLAYAKNHNLGFEVPYLAKGEPRRYRPDFLVRVDDGGDTPLTLVLEVKGFRGHDVPLKVAAIRDRWVPAVNRLGRFGRWDFGELRDPYRMAEELDELIMKHVGGRAA